LANLEGDGIGLKGGPEGSRRGTAHSEVQGRGDKSAPERGTVMDCHASYRLSTDF